MKAYIYPMVNARKHKVAHNPYIDNFINSLNTDIIFLNHNQPSSGIGILDLWKYIWKIDILFLNWIEDLPSRKGGNIQWFIFHYIFLFILKIRKVKICWTLHNKQPHDENNRRKKMNIFNKLFSVSNYIITHASEGKSIAESKGYSKKLIFFHHPINERKRVKSSFKKEIDIFIWGTITPYKGVDAFLELVSNNSKLKKYKILIAGKITDKEYKSHIKMKLSSNIQLRDEILSDQELEKNLSKSKITLFTYNKDSVLSSGALSDSIGYGNIVIGPETGSFKDLGDMQLIYIYKDFNQIPELCEKILSDFFKYQIDESAIKDYLDNHSWETFGQVILSKIAN